MHSQGLALFDADSDSDLGLTSTARTAVTEPQDSPESDSFSYAALTEVPSAPAETLRDA